MMIECPHCHMKPKYQYRPKSRAAAKVQDLSVFRVKCPNCGETVLAVHPCLYP